MNNKHSIKNSISSMRKKSFLSIQARMCILFGLLFATMLAVVVMLIMYGIPFTPFKGEYLYHKTSALQKISLVADLKKDRLLFWMKERRGDAEVLSEDFKIKVCIKELSTIVHEYNASGIKEEGLRDNVQKEKCYRYLLQRMNLIKSVYGAYNRISFADASTGLIMASTHNEVLGTDISNQDFFSHVMQPGIKEIIDIDRVSSSDKFSLYISRTINLEDSDQGKVAVLIMHIDPDDFIRPMLHTGGGLGKTSEALLVDQEARILTYLKYPLADGSVAKPLEYKIKAKPATLAAHGEQGMIVSVDYRGVPVLAAYRHIRISSEQGWGLVVKTDMAEALVAINNDKIYFVVIGLVCVLLVVGLVTLIASRISRPILKLTKTVQHVEEGNLNIQSQIATSDEVGILAHAFNKMLDNINASFKEKEVLLNEINHRVKNNMQLIAGLLRLQSEGVEDKHLLSLFNESQNRIKSMALIHEDLYTGKDLARVDLGRYTRILTARLIKSFGVDSSRILTSININGIFLSVNYAIPCGLILNELFTNSVKYAFPLDRLKDRDGQICIDCRSNGAEHTLVFSDNGVGIPEDLDIQKVQTLGLDLVKSLTQQLKGTIELNRDNGTEFKITFKV